MSLRLFALFGQSRRREARPRIRVRKAPTREAVGSLSGDVVRGDFNNVVEITGDESEAK
jgi:hypothetical protein